MVKEWSTFSCKTSYSIYIYFLYPCIGNVVASHAEVVRSILAELRLHRFLLSTRGSRVFPNACRLVNGATSQLDLPSLTSLSKAGCGRLQLGVPHWATSIYYCK